MDRDELIQEKAEAKTYPVSSWQFKPTHHFYVNNHDTDAYVGDITYSNLNYEFGSAIKIRNWVFVLEKLVPETRQILIPDDKEFWMIAAFNGRTHYSFQPIDLPESEIGEEFVKYILEIFWPILHSDISNFCLEWKVVPL